MFVLSYAQLTVIKGSCPSLVISYVSNICIRLIESKSSVKCISFVFVVCLDVNSSIWYVETHVDKLTFHVKSFIYMGISMHLQCVHIIILINH